MMTYWNKLIKKYDKKGYAPLYKQMTESFFSTLSSEIFAWSKDKIKGVDSLAITDVEYLDGYYLFPMGTNSVVHFKIKECPGWLFGIWWQEPVKEDKKSKTFRLKGTFFTQYEEVLDKFKPSASTIKEDFSAVIVKKSRDPELNTWHLSYIGKIMDAVRFIIRDPALAFCRDYCGWDYNTEYHDRRSAKKKFEEWQKWNTDKKTYTKICDDKIISFAKEKLLLLCGKTAELYDQGENVSPRYQMICRLSDAEGEIKGPGYYELNLEEYPEIGAEWLDLEEECKAISDKYEFYWFNPLSNSCLVLDDDKYDLWKAEEDN